MVIPPIEPVHAYYSPVVCLGLVVSDLDWTSARQGPREGEANINSKQIPRKSPVPNIERWRAVSSPLVGGRI